MQLASCITKKPRTAPEWADRLKRQFSSLSDVTKQLGMTTKYNKKLMSTLGEDGDAYEKGLHLLCDEFFEKEKSEKSNQCDVPREEQKQVSCDPETDPRILAGTHVLEVVKEKCGGKGQFVTGRRVVPKEE